MPRNVIGPAPFPPVKLFDDDRDFAVEDLRRIARERPLGATICIRYPAGSSNRGGYFFHFKPTSASADKFEIFDFQKRPVATFSEQSLIDFVNHCTGRRFHEPSFLRCQTELNFLRDEQPDA